MSTSALDPHRGLMASVLDRLIDPESSGTRARPGYNLQQLLRSVRRDLEALLNTRQLVVVIPEDFVEVRKSVLNYGFPDVSSLSAATSARREEICRIIEKTVLKHEPRLRDIRARSLEPKEGEVQTARFTIDARLDLDPSPHVVFATILDLSTGHTSIKSGDT